MHVIYMQPRHKSITLGAFSVLDGPPREGDSSERVSLTYLGNWPCNIENITFCSWPENIVEHSGASFVRLGPPTHVRVLKYSDGNGNGMGI